MRLLVLFLFLLNVVSAQRIQAFNVFENDGSVVLKFSVKPGPTCFGFSVLHSTDSLIYVEVGSDPAICGVSTLVEDKNYVHLKPSLNTVNYYKVRLEPSIETSAVRKIFVDYNDGTLKMSAYPNPFYLEDVVSLKLFGVNNVQLKGFLYNYYGDPVKAIEVSPVQNRAAISTSELVNGAYLVWLTNGLKTFTCKIIILR
ncbi:T9SS type A sorting domain-containing protein [Aurantibacillus circumpalustris]|uniref:T9SS type A sorting domain-containing protein n=1 Tax=Aurantibacillus circumpalustris TaxID=3036359 RepID=UPI00295B860E|nr:T9SS type A sorting domain-containing protein [Aurantibacillus circumpalustris]